MRCKKKSGCELDVSPSLSNFEETVYKGNFELGWLNYVSENLFKCTDAFLLKAYFPIVHN